MATARAGSAVRAELIEGSASAALLKAAASADLLVVGSRGRGGLRSMLFGSVAHVVTNHGTCPVVVIHGAAHPDGRQVAAAVRRRPSRRSPPRSRPTVGEIWRAFGLKPGREDSFKVSPDPDLVERSATSSPCTRSATSQTVALARLALAT